MIGGRSESNSGQDKYEVDLDVTCFECRQPGYYRNDYPKLIKEIPKDDYPKRRRKV